MQFHDTDLADVVRVEVDRRSDERGWFGRIWCEAEFEAAGRPIRFTQFNAGVSDQTGTLRGMHLQTAPHGEWKLVRCTRGSVFDVVVDLRRGSTSLGRWVGFELTAASGTQLLVPPGCAHGYQTLEPDTELVYMTSEAYAPGAATGVRWDDPAFGVDWPLAAGPMSEQDKTWDAWQGVDDPRNEG